MTKGEKEFMVSDGGYHQFEGLVLDKVHTLNGPEGDALQRIIKCCNCPFLALGATIVNTTQLQSWLQKYLIVTESDGKDGKKKYKQVKLHPVATMTPEYPTNDPVLIAALSMTPTDYIKWDFQKGKYDMRIPLCMQFLLYIVGCLA